MAENYIKRNYKEKNVCSSSLLAFNTIFYFILNAFRQNITKLFIAVFPHNVN